jgi:uncharacterized membrane protein YdbT with pleckstrin-like domain
MDENSQKYYPLGQKTLFMFVFKKSLYFFSLFPFLLIGILALAYVPYNYLQLTLMIILWYIGFLLLVFILMFLIGWLQYFRYAIYVDDQDLKLQRGFIAVEEIGIPYRHIKDLKIERSLLDQIFGVSDIIVTVLGEEAKKTEDQEIEITLPSIEKSIALQIQNSVLKRAQVEQVHMLKWGKNMV